MSKIKKGNFWIPKPQVFAESALGTVGLERVTNGYWSHNITVSYQYFHFCVKQYKFVEHECIFFPLRYEILHILNVGYSFITLKRAVE